MAGVKGKSGRKPNELVIRQNLSNILDEIDPSTERKRLLNILHKLVEAAEEGKMDAMNTVFDRLEGKVPQAVTGDPENPLEMIHRIELVAANGDGES